MTRALIVVDVQVDFCEGGALPVSGGSAVAERISAHLDQAAYDVSLATRDWHVDPGGHFSTKPDYHESWPVHCVADSPAAQLHPALARHHLDCFDKGRRTAAYSAFEALGLPERLTQAGVGDLFICGLATDYCVRATALDAVRRGYRTTLLADLTAGVAPETTAQALAEMRAAGVAMGFSNLPAGYEDGPAAESALITDAYEITMATSYLHHGLNPTSTFSLFVRRLPRSRGFLVAAGIEDCVDFLLGTRFTQADLEFLHAELHLNQATLDELQALRFTGDVWAIPEGRVVLANEPLLEVTAPLVEAQLPETYLLNRMTLQTMLATKAVRCVLAAAGATLVDFGLRRTQGVDAGMQIARLSALAGFAGTSNLAAARQYGLPAVGTMAHSYVQAFANEEQAFHAFADDFPERCTFLVDTYDTTEGVRIAARVIRDRGLGSTAAIRLDSGDLVSLAKESRVILDEAGLPDVRILASGGLDEFQIEHLVAAGAPVDAYGVGTKLGVSADAPYLDTAYKLVALDDSPVLKLSPGKRTLPGAKQVFRSLDENGCFRDLLALRDEPRPAGAGSLLVPYVLAGRRVRPHTTLEASRALLHHDLGTLSASSSRLTDPVALLPVISADLEALTAQTRARHTSANRDS